MVSMLDILSGASALIVDVRQNGSGREGWRINRKRTQRLWRDEGLRRPQQCRKRRRGPDGERPCATRPNEVWAADFQFDETADGRRLKLLNIVDEFTREALAMRVGRSCDADDVVATIEALVAERGAPAHLRMDIHTESHPDSPVAVRPAA